jgi:hypothetical protein
VRVVSIRTLPGQERKRKRRTRRRKMTRRKRV